MNELMLIAKSPSEMEEAQKNLLNWVSEKIIVMSADLRDAKQNLALAKENKWRTVGWYARVVKARAQVGFYEKIKAAVQAGYYIVPPFPVNLIAIRTDRETPVRYQSEHRYALTALQPAQVLPVGDGKYVGPLPPAVPGKVWAKPYGKKEFELVDGWQTADWHADASFPFKLVKPQILESLAQALKEKIFDQIGLVQQTPRSDPVLIGQILSPSKNRPPINFFVAWWLDTRDLR